MTEHQVVDHDTWIEARMELLAREKEFSRLRDELSRRRRELPWERVVNDYVFDTPAGAKSLAELFDGRSQLAVYHFMFGPDDEAGCPHCSFWADSFDSNIVHLNARDVTFVACSRAPLERLAAYKQRMGWTFTWVSSAGTDFNFDYGVSFSPEQRTRGASYNFGSEVVNGSEREGVSIFFKDEGGNVFRTYSTYARGIDLLNAAYNYLDLVPKGRGEDGHKVQYWVRRRDEYGLT
jgi:predicted dithiol-disulfide oxidoreductase (DUF899 family)